MRLPSVDQYGKLVVIRAKVRVEDGRSALKGGIHKIKPCSYNKEPQEVGRREGGRIVEFNHRDSPESGI